MAPIGRDPHSLAEMERARAHRPRGDLLSHADHAQHESWASTAWSASSLVVSAPSFNEAAARMPRKLNNPIFTGALGM